MNTICWNICGLGNPQSVQVLRDIITLKRPKFLFLLETKAKQARVEFVRRSLDFSGCFAVDSVGIRGGIAFFWKDQDSIRVIGSSQNFIDVEVSSIEIGPIRMTGFYGYPERSKRRHSWDLLRDLRGRSTLPWVILGDFNYLISPLEKRGGVRHP